MCKELCNSSLIIFNKCLMESEQIIKCLTVIFSTKLQLIETLLWILKHRYDFKLKLHVLSYVVFYQKSLNFQC